MSSVNFPNVSRIWFITKSLYMRQQRSWLKCCEWEGLSPDSKITLFGLRNPYAPRYYRECDRLIRFMARHKKNLRPAGQSQAA